MSKKLTLTVSDELHERLKKWRGEINFSRIFQNAVIAHVKKKEAFHIKLEEKKTYQQVWESGDLTSIEGQFELGKELGFVWAKSAAYREIKKFEKFEERWNEQDHEVIRQFYKEVNFLSLLDQFGLIAMELPLDQDEPLTPISNYLDLGFLTGIVEFVREEYSVSEVERPPLNLRAEIYFAKDDNGHQRIFRG
jgi:post-segregation antitoxin (ccd killing protein)